jgi:hypothetical protein
MPTTTNNGWTIPANTDLVKDGAAAIRTLGQAIDTTLGVYSPSTAGLVKINTTTFSGVSSQSVNSVFSSTYSNYKILITSTCTAGFETAFFRLRLSGSDATGTNYAWQKVGASGSSMFPSRSTTQTTYELGYIRSGSIACWSLDVFSPNIAETTKFINSQSDPAGTTPEYYSNSGLHSLSTAYDGFTFYAGSGNITGNVSVYGYSK